MGLPYNFHSLKVYIHDSTGIYVSYFKITIIRLYVVKEVQARPLLICKTFPLTRPTFCFDFR